MAETKRSMRWGYIGSAEALYLTSGSCSSPASRSTAIFDGSNAIDTVGAATQPNGTFAAIVRSPISRDKHLCGDMPCPPTRSIAGRRRTKPCPASGTRSHRSPGPHRHRPAFQAHNRADCRHSTVQALKWPVDARGRDRRQPHPTCLTALLAKKAVKKKSPADAATRSCVNSRRIRFLTSRSDDAHSSSGASIDAPAIHDLSIMVVHRFRDEA